MANAANIFINTVSQTNAASRNKIMLINQDRIAYSGLLGAPTKRSFGSLTVYVSLSRPLRISVASGCWSEVKLAVIAPYISHQIASEEQHIGVVMIEPESVDLSRLPNFMTPGSDPALAEIPLEKLRFAFAHLQQRETDAEKVDFDDLFFGERLARRCMDRRIEAVAEVIRIDPCASHNATASAGQACLSFSRFLHLFAAELGTSYRRYCAWKRARNMLPYVTQGRNLTDIALDMGYPDSTHFSHSIRNIYGLRPKDIFAGSKRLSLIELPPQPQCGEPPTLRWFGTPASQLKKTSSHIRQVAAA